MGGMFIASNDWLHIGRFTLLPIHSWWYVKGYGTILGMMILVLRSMVYLYVNSFGRKLGQSTVKDRLGISCK